MEMGRVDERGEMGDERTWRLALVEPLVSYAILRCKMFVILRVMCEERQRSDRSSIRHLGD